MLAKRKFSFKYFGIAECKRILDNNNKNTLYFLIGCATTLEFIKVFTYARKALEISFI